jgi:hypothetical protein
MKIQDLFDLVHGIRDLYPTVEFEAIYSGYGFIGYKVYYKQHTLKVYTYLLEYRLHSSSPYADRGDLDFILCSMIDLFDDTLYIHTYCSVCGEYIKHQEECIHQVCDHCKAS